MYDLIFNKIPVSSHKGNNNVSEELGVKEKYIFSKLILFFNLVQNIPGADNTKNGTLMLQHD